MNTQELKDSQDVSRILSGLAPEAFRPAPFLATRVKARLEERHRESRSLALWRRLGLAGLISSGALAALAIFFLVPGLRGGSFDATVGTPFALRVEMSGVKVESVAEVEIELPDDVSFFSAKHPEVAKERRLRIAYEPGSGPRTLPFVLSSSRAGKAAVKVRFFGAGNSLLLEKTLEVRVAAAAAAPVRKEIL